MSSQKKTSSQNIQMGNISVSGGSSFDLNQVMADNSENSILINTRESFLSELDRVIVSLGRFKNYPEVIEAINEIKFAKAESQKSQPAPNVIKRFLNSAKGILRDIAESVTTIGAIVGGITLLIEAIKPVFGG